MADPLGRRRLVVLTPGDVRAAIRRWQAAGAEVAGGCEAGRVAGGEPAGEGGG
jgi:hypothetical protein